MNCFSDVYPLMTCSCPAAFPEKEKKAILESWNENFFSNNRDLIYKLTFYLKNTLNVQSIIMCLSSYRNTSQSWFVFIIFVLLLSFLFSSTHTQTKLFTNTTYNAILTCTLRWNTPFIHIPYFTVLTLQLQYNYILLKWKFGILNKDQPHVSENIWWITRADSQWGSAGLTTTGAKRVWVV